MEYRIERFVVTDFEVNCYVLHANSDAVVIDPGSPGEILQYLQKHDLTLRMILNTHGHIDHICGNLELREATGADIAIGEEDAPMLADTLLCGADVFGWEYRAHRAQQTLHEGESVGYGPMQFEVIETPGHSPGSISLYDVRNAVLFPGDLVFMGSIGRYDLPGADRETIFRSLRKFLALPDDVTVYPGHGPATSVAQERSTNPYLLELQRW